MCGVDVSKTHRRFWGPRVAEILFTPLETPMFLKSFATLCVATFLSVGFTSTADAGCLAGLFGKCCKPDCCEPAPAPCCPAPAPAPVCCKPAPPADINTTVCLVDPCTGCSKSVNVCIPACCGNEKPCISSRKGLFGRKVFTITWKCCGHSVKAVWTKRGCVRVH